MTYPPLQRELPGGLVLRNGRPGDTERVVSLLNRVFVQQPGGPPKPECEPWARDMASGRHPFTNLDRLILVEDPAAERFVSCSWNIPMRWSYDGVEFGVARPETVATDVGYRGRGLVRHIIEAMHHRSEAEGDLAQAITGILHYYRQFDYEYALELGGGRKIALEHIATLSPTSGEDMRIEPATPADMPFLMELANRRRVRSMVSPVLTESYWQWMTNGINPECGLGWLPLILRTAGHAQAGFALVRQRRFGSAVSVLAAEVEDGVSWWEMRDPLLRTIANLAQRIPAMPTINPAAAHDVSLALGSAHPIYDVLTPDLRPIAEEPYAWFVRVPDIAMFLRHIAPVLATRLSGSGFAGFSKEIVIDFYRDELVLRFEGGELCDATMRRRTGQPTDAAIPRLVFLQMLFGRRSFDELHHVLPDVWARPAAKLLLEVLFPVRASLVHPIT